MLLIIVQSVSWVRTRPAERRVAGSAGAGRQEGRAGPEGAVSSELTTRPTVCLPVPGCRDRCCCTSRRSASWSLWSRHRGRGPGNSLQKYNVTYRTFKMMGYYSLWQCHTWRGWVLGNTSKNWFSYIHNTKRKLQIFGSNQFWIFCRLIQLFNVPIITSIISLKEWIFPV